MASVAFHTFNQFSATGTMKLFKGTKAGVEDGMQMRDFVYVKDAAAVVSHFLEVASNAKPAPSGIYNIGTGKARSFKDLAINVMQSMRREPHMTFIDMPQDLQGKYQYFTEASMSKLAEAGYTQAFHSLEDGVRDYVQNYLMKEDKYC
jgi:ADP-L-glycero-D-manno-heptose 6-epimerase